ncbi:hypothetical protein WISP_79085 [Willisornis vidua]|uniref:Uncharacterized protein n=1 Tax=Willisornis vidua TaxID=1566151 RepID=A0ABQ9DB14_9PASS|nr:hypothetical protein WISP_79085 [Willisornis vidua]
MKEHHFSSVREEQKIEFVIFKARSSLDFVHTGRYGVVEKLMINVLTPGSDALKTLVTLDTVAKEGNSTI